MMIDRNIQVFGIALLVLAAVLVSLSAVIPFAQLGSSQPKDAIFIPVTGTEASLAQYYQSERAAPVNTQNGLDIYYQSERCSSENKKINDPLNLYHQSEWFGK